MVLDFISNTVVSRMSMSHNITPITENNNNNKLDSVYSFSNTITYISLIYIPYIKYTDTFILRQKQ